MWSLFTCFLSIESEEILHLRKETIIYQLKQEMASLKEDRDHSILKLEERVEELISENEQLRGYLSIKEGAAGVVCVIDFTYVLCANS